MPFENTNLVIEAKDIIAIVLVIGCLILLCFKIDSIVGGILIAIVAYYYGIHIPYNGLKQQKKGK